MGLMDGLIKGLMGSFDKEAYINETIQKALENAASELECAANELFIMIVPTDADFNFKCCIFRMPANSAPVKVRDISLKEILDNAPELGGD